MANQYKNKIIYGNQTLMDITDTTATENDVLEGEVFYTASGARGVGTLGDATTTAHGLMSASDKIKLDGIDLLGVKLNTTTLTPDANGYVSIPLMTGATSSTNGVSGLVPAPTTADVDKFLAGDGTYKSGGLPMVILSYGNSTWDDFITAYNNHVIVYCRASSNSNPKTGSQTRMAFMAYVNNAETPTEVEFQYYRSMSSHSATQMGDQVYVYKLTNKNAWTVTVREASVKQVNVSGSGLSASWSNNQVTLSNTMTAADMPMSSSDTTKVDSAISTLSDQIVSLEDGLAIVVDGNQTAYIGGAAIGDYILMKNSTITGITDGGYIAAKAFPANTVIDSTYLTACSKGIANSLSEQIETVNSKLLNIGTLYTSGNSDNIVSIPAATSASDPIQTSSIYNLPAGRYLLYATIIFASTSGVGTRQAMFFSQGPQGGVVSMAFELGAKENNWLTNSAVAVIEAVEGSSASLGVKQYSGAAMEVHTRLYALRLSA